MVGFRLASFLLPTRKRVEKLKSSLLSIEQTTIHHNDIEVLVRVDDDDVETISYLSTAHFKYHLSVTVGPRGQGYADLHHMYNQLCSLSSGRFLFLWNDDATMITHAWDNEIRKHDDDKLWYLRSGIDDGRGKDPDLFPIVHRSYYETLGHFSLSAHNDTYINEIFLQLPQFIKMTNIVVKHSALSLINENDVTSIEGMAKWPETKNLYRSKEVQDNIKIDIQKLNQFVESNQRSL